MKRLNTENINEPRLTIDIFNKRWKKELNYINWERFSTMAKHFRGGKFLDLGVFNSPLIIEIEKKFVDVEVVGLDYCEPVLRELQERHPEVRYVVGDAMHIQFKDEYFDYVVAGELIEHMEDPVAFVKEAMRVLKKGGIFSLSTPEGEGTRGDKANPDHLWSFSKQDMNNLLKPYGKVEIIDVIKEKPLVHALIVHCFKND